MTSFDVDWYDSHVLGNVQKTVPVQLAVASVIAPEDPGIGLRRVNQQASRVSDPVRAPIGQDREPVRQHLPTYVS